MLENMDNYHGYEQLVHNQTMCVNTSILNRVNSLDHFNSVLNILKDGIEEQYVQDMYVMVTFTDNVTIKLSIFDYLMNLIFWQLPISVGADIDSLKLFFPDNLTVDYIGSYINNVFVRDYRSKIPFKQLNNSIDVIFVMFKNLKGFQMWLGNTLTLKDTIDLMNEDPEFEATFHFDASKVQFDDVKDEALRNAQIQINKILQTEHCFRDQFATDQIIKKGQYNEVFSCVGTKPSGFGVLFPVPITNSYVNGGLNDPAFIVIDSSVGRIAKIIEKVNVGMSGSFARVLGLNNKDSMFNPDPNYSCHTKHFMKVNIKNNQWLRIYDGRYYRTNPKGIDHVIDARTDKHLIGQTIYVRSPITCASYSHGKGVCHKCYGDLFWTNRDINPGKIAAETESERFTQTMLSAKHLLESKVIKKDWINRENFFNLFDVQFNSLSIRPEMYDNLKKFKLHIPMPLDEDEDTDIPSYRYSTSRIIVEYPNGQMESYGTTNADPFYLHEDLLAVLEEYDTSGVEDLDEVVIDMETLIDLPVVFMIDVANEDISSTMNNIKKMLDNKGGLIKDRHEFLDAFVEANLKGRISIDAVHFEMMLANQIRCPDNMVDIPDWEAEHAPYQMITLSDALLYNPSVTVRLEYSHLSKVLRLPSTYSTRKPSSYDLFFMKQPQEFLKEDGIVSSINTLIDDEDNKELETIFDIPPVPKDEQ